MKQIRFYDGYKKPITLALGFFDSIHTGHQELIETAKEKAKELGCESAIMTFSNNPFLSLGRGAMLVYNYAERVKILSELGVGVVIHQTFDEAFMKTPPAKFLDSLKNLYIVKHIVCGGDYKFGAVPQGTPDTLREFFAPLGASVTVVDDVLVDGVRASSTLVRNELLAGNIRHANKFLGLPYRVSGLVEKGHAIGQDMGYPTANIKSPQISTILKSGVYSVFCIIDGVRYEGVANAGTRPTFGEDIYKVETHLVGFSEDLYGRELTVYFKDFLRDIKKFDSREELKTQIAKDLKKSNECK